MSPVTIKIVSRLLTELSVWNLQRKHRGDVGELRLFQREEIPPHLEEKHLLEAGLRPRQNKRESAAGEMRRIRIRV